MQSEGEMLFSLKWNIAHLLDFGSFLYAAEVLLDVKRVRVVLLKDHDQVVQHGYVPIE